MWLSSCARMAGKPREGCLRGISGSFFSPWFFRSPRPGSCRVHALERHGGVRNCPGTPGQETCRGGGSEPCVATSVNGSVAWGSTSLERCLCGRVARDALRMAEAAATGTRGGGTRPRRVCLLGRWCGSVKGALGVGAAGIGVARAPKKKKRSKKRKRWPTCAGTAWTTRRSRQSWTG